MTVCDKNVLDIVMVEGNNYVLVISDHLEWTFETRTEHAKILQDKLNCYFGYIFSGQAEEAKPGLRPVVRVIAKYPYSRYAIDFLERVRAYVKANGDICELEWTHPDDSDITTDGFSDEFELDPAKVYPRLKKNWAEDPSKEIAFMAISEDCPDKFDNLVGFGIWDSYVIVLMQDNNKVFTYLTYDKLPEDMDPTALENTAFENLNNNITYRSVDSKEPGIFGIVAGGDFEAEILLFTGIWEEIAGELKDDVVVAVPTKDVVLYTAAGNSELRSKMFSMAEETLRRNMKESPELVFSKDVFLYSREAGALQPTGETYC